MEDQPNELNGRKISAPPRNFTKDKPNGKKLEPNGRERSKYGFRRGGGNGRGRGRGRSRGGRGGRGRSSNREQVKDKETDNVVMSNGNVNHPDEEIGLDENQGHVQNGHNKNFETEKKNVHHKSKNPERYTKRGGGGRGRGRSGRNDSRSGRGRHFHKKRDKKVSPDDAEDEAGEKYSNENLGSIPLFDVEVPQVSIGDTQQSIDLTMDEPIDSKWEDMQDTDQDENLKEYDVTTEPVMDNEDDEDLRTGTSAEKDNNLEKKQATQPKKIRSKAKKDKKKKNFDYQKGEGKEIVLLTRNNAKTLESAETFLKDHKSNGFDKESKKEIFDNEDQTTNPPANEPQNDPEPLSSISVLKALPAQEVSITATTSVQIRKSASTASLASSTQNSNSNKFMNSNGSTKPKKHRKSKTKGLSDDKVANQHAARKFNREVRSCVENSDPEGLTDLLHNKKFRNYALEASVLETVMKAYVMAAMFDDALYCLRNCTLPGTLSPVQTEKILGCLPQNLRNSSAYTAADMINALCIATEFDHPTSRTYFLRIVRGIALEFLEEATSARDRICSAPCERLVRSAQCVVDASLRRGKKAAEIVVHPGNQLGVFVPDTLENRGIQAGDAVSILPYAGPYPMSAESLDRNMIEATVTSAQPLNLKLQDKTNAQLHAMLTDRSEGNVYRIDKLANRMGFNRQLNAAVAIASFGEHVRRDNRRPCPELIQAITAMDQNIDMILLGAANGQYNVSQNRDRNSRTTSTAELCAQAVPWDDDDDNNDEDSIRAASKLALEKYGALEGLNESQRLAVEGAATNRLTLVQGPPGTGKTAVAIRILQHWARLSAVSERGNPILATSDSNIAVDNLVEGCANVGLRVVRLGRPEAIRPELLRYCVDRPQTNNSNSYSNSSSGQAFKEKLKAIKNAEVICCTCIGSGSEILDNMTFERVLVDEATQATEPAVLVPLARGCRQLVLVGDHCQLPPTVLSTRAEEEGLGVPLFSRMVACGVPPFMLDTQYRMHPSIAMFPSDLFYGGKLRNGVSPPERRPLAGFPWPREEFPVAFLPVNQGIEMDDGVSKLNEAEAAAACDAVAALLSGGQCSVSDIAVVTPYAAQVRLIRRMTRKLVQRPPYVEVSSTDGFQGREKEAVVFSAVRSNDYGAVGFVSDWRRVNVSFTRARRALIVIGNDITLRRGDPDTWMPWLAWADAHGVNMDKPGIPRGRYDADQLRRVRGGTTAAEMLKDVLARQQAQREVAANQLKKAEKNAEGHIRADKEVEEDTKFVKIKSIHEDLADLANEHGCWDDSSDDDWDEDNGKVNHKVMAYEKKEVESDKSMNGDEQAMDVWDL